MTTEIIKNKYLELFENINKVGKKVKLGVLFVFTIFFILIVIKNIFHYSETTLNPLIAYIIFCIIFYTAIILAKPYLFVLNGSLQNIRAAIKSDFYQLVKQEVPEIVNYNYLQKIHPNTFNNSALFDDKHDNFKGDDLFGGVYKEVNFELCELHVHKTFKDIFNGIFIVAHFADDKSLESLKNNSAIDNAVSKFETKYGAKLKTSITQNRFYITIEIDGNFFEFRTIKSLDNIDYQLGLVKDSVEIVKTIVDSLPAA